MDILEPIVRHLTYPAYLRRDGIHVQPYLSQLLDSQYWSEQRLLDHQLGKLQELSSYVYETSPFYRRRFDEAGLHPSDIDSTDDIAALPILTKNDIRDAGNSLFSQGFNKNNTVHKRTGGSTSVPLHIYMDREAYNFKAAATLRHDAWAGLMPGKKTAAIWGDTDKQQPLKTRIRNFLSSRAIYLDTLAMTEERLERFTRQIHDRRPSILIGHANSIYMFASYIKSRSVVDIRFEGIITTAMVLHAGERSEIESTFNSPVFNRYGCEELSVIASESSAHSGLHVLSEGLFIEPLGQNPERPGEIIITDLVNKAMPLIRYQIGDRAVDAVGKCVSEIGLPRIAQISGRTADFLYRPDGTPVFGISILDTFVIHIVGIRQAQIVQRSLTELEVRIVKSAAFASDTVAQIRTAIDKVFGSQMRMRIEYVDVIQQTERGKYRFSICEIEGTLPKVPPGTE